jgi:hypothetical protein
MDTPWLEPVLYAGELVALVSPRRAYIVAPWLRERPSGDADLRFVAYMCAYGVEVLAGRLPGPFTSATAEAVVRRALIPPSQLSALQTESDAKAAVLLRVPVAQIARARASSVGSR